MIDKIVRKLKVIFLIIYHRFRWFLKRILDAFNFLILKILSVKKRKFVKENVKKVLIINLQGIGDLIMMTPLVESLKKEFGKIDILCYKNNGEVFKNDKRIGVLRFDKVINTIYKIRKNKYDLVICPYRAEHAGFLTAISNAKYKIGYIYSLKISTNNFHIKKCKKTRDPRLKADNIRKALRLSKVRDYDDPFIEEYKKEKNKIDKFLEKYKNKTKISFFCSNNWKSRKWPAEKWIGLGGKILKKDKNAILFLIGHKENKKENEYIREKILETDLNSKRVLNICGKFNLTETISFLKKIDVFITTDSGPMHLAFAAKTKKIISLFGSTNPYHEVPKKYMKSVIWKNKNGKLCPLWNYNNEPLIIEVKCMEAISVKNVIEKLK